ncbi:sugar ABC transporter permease [Nocardioides sp. KR10-350]|uniref:carbohydrate ABC transporter permease n=1 Tax=Nocardioides cheoyonin TaxID=3156615 RepID=UPI0032B4E0FC
MTVAETTGAQRRPALAQGSTSGRRRVRRSSPRVPFLFAVPSIAGLLLLMVYPTVYLLGLAFTESNLALPLQRWTGLTNFTDALQSTAFPGSISRSVVFAAASTVLVVVTGTALALLLRARGDRLGVLGVLLLLPLVTPPVMVGVAWKLMLAPVGGAFTGIWSHVGLDGFNPLGSSTGAFLTLLLIYTWQWMPLVTILVFAALLDVPRDLVEAAQLDGAGRIAVFHHVVWPSIRTTVWAALLLALVLGFKVFDLVVVVTSGGPGFSTMLSSFFIYRTGLQNSYEIGVASAATVIFVAVVSAVMAIVGIARKRAVAEA